jgi:hypothetical protein
MKADATNQKRYAIILAGGDGTRLSEITRRISGDSIPKQFCPLIGDASLIEQTRFRVSLAVDKNRIRILTVLNRVHERHYRDLVNEILPENRVIQPANRGTADAELIYVRGIPPDATYRFKHSLIRDAAYGALLRSRRKELHSQIAEILGQQFPERVASAPELPARHYTEAGLLEQAISCWHRAGQASIERSANAEAISHLTKGLEVLELLPDGSERVQQELALLTNLGAAFIAAKGCAAPEVKTNLCASARALQPQ